MARFCAGQAFILVVMAFSASLGFADEHLNGPAKKTAKQAGIGAALAIEDGNVIIFKILPETPASRSGLLQPDDRIVAVAEEDGEPVQITGMKMTAAVGMIRGPEGSLVRLTIIPAGGSPEDARVVRLRRGTFSELDMFVDGRLLPTGAVAPDFRFQNLSDARESDLTGFPGRVVVVHIWASWCGPCIQSLNKSQTMIGEHPEWEGKVEILVVSVDEEKEDAVRTAKDSSWSSMRLAWTGPKLLELYRIGSLPAVFVIDERGRIAAADNRLDVPQIVKSLQQKQRQDSPCGASRLRTQQQAATRLSGRNKPSDSGHRGTVADDGDVEVCF